MQNQLNNIKLEIWGKAKRESARRPKSDWGKLGRVKRGENFPGIKVTWPELKCIGICRTRIVDLEQVNTSAYNLVRGGRNFTKNFLFNAEKIVLVNAVQIMSLSSSVPEIFAYPNFKRVVPPKFVLALTPQHKDMSSAKVSSGYTP